jgi:hypothetical protein
MASRVWIALIQYTERLSIGGAVAIVLALRARVAHSGGGARAAHSGRARRGSVAGEGVHGARQRWAVAGLGVRAVHGVCVAGRDIVARGLECLQVRFFLNSAVFP